MGVLSRPPNLPPGTLLHPLPLVLMVPRGHRVDFLLSGGGGHRLGKDKVRSQKPATGLTDRQALPRPGWAVRWAGVSRCLVGSRRQGGMA